MDTDNYQGNAVINYNEAKYPFTRIIEHKHFEFGKQPSTIITKEYPQKYTPSDEPYYPINDEKNLKCFNKYKALAEKIPMSFSEDVWDNMHISIWMTLLHQPYLSPKRSYQSKRTKQ